MCKAQPVTAVGIVCNAWLGSVLYEGARSGNGVVAGQSSARQWLVYAFGLPEARSSGMPNRGVGSKRKQKSHNARSKYSRPWDEISTSQRLHENTQGLHNKTKNTIVNAYPFFRLGSARMLPAYGFLPLWVSWLLTALWPPVMMSYRTTVSLAFYFWFRFTDGKFSLANALDQT
jgi:hypothetical protein